MFLSMRRQNTASRLKTRARWPGSGSAITVPLLERAKKFSGSAVSTATAAGRSSWPADGVYGTCPQGSDVEMLKGLKTIVIAAHEAVARLEAEVAVLPEEVAARRQDGKSEEQERQLKYKQLIADQINSVTI